jgi:hypothetical protein
MLLAGLAVMGSQARSRDTGFVAERTVFYMGHVVACYIRAYNEIAVTCGRLYMSG